MTLIFFPQHPPILLRLEIAAGGGSDYMELFFFSFKKRLLTLKLGAHCLLVKGRERRRNLGEREWNGTADALDKLHVRR